MRWHLLLFGLVALLGVALAASAVEAKSARIEVEVTGKRKDEPAREHFTVWMSGRRVRIEARTPGEKQAPHVLIYRGDRDRFYSIDTRKQAYLEVNRDVISAFSTTMVAARREVDGQIQRLPEDQHFAMESFLGMRKLKKPRSDAPIQLLGLAAQDRVGDFECRKSEVRRGMRKVGEICTVPWAEVGIHEEDLVVFRQLANFQRELMGARELTPLEFVPNQPLDIMVQLDGFPLYLKKMVKGEVTSEIKVLSAKRSVPDQGLYEVPDDYRIRTAYELFLENMRPSPAAVQ